MDPIAHTLAGATLAQTGLKRLTPLAATTLIVGANLPDVDGIATLWGGDVSLCVRRGWTHGILADLALPLLLTGVMLVADRARRAAATRWGRRAPPAPARPLPLLALAFLGVWSHPALDWLNTYGVRLLMPFSGTWFYGDAVFIIDPWLWLVFAAGAVVATRSVAGIAGWTVLGLALTTLLLFAGEVPAPARAAWLAGVVTLIGLRSFVSDPARVQSIARGALSIAVVYILLMIAGSGVARRHAERALNADGRAGRVVMAGPLPADPFSREIIVRHDDRYSFHVVHLPSGEMRPLSPDVPINGPTPVTDAALAAPGMRGLANWLRFPTYQVDRLPHGYRVTVRDVRYSRFGERARGIGTGAVELDEDLRLLDR